MACIGVGGVERVCEAAVAKPVARGRRRGADDAERICGMVRGKVARQAGLSAADLLGPTRGAPLIARHRQTAMYLAHVVFGVSFTAIARSFQRDRTTVAHACRQVEDRRDDMAEDLRIAGLEQACRMQQGLAADGGEACHVAA